MSLKWIGLYDNIARNNLTKMLKCQVSLRTKVLQLWLVVPVVVEAVDVVLAEKEIWT